MRTLRSRQNRFQRLESRQCLTSIGFSPTEVGDDNSPTLRAIADVDGDNDFDIILSTGSNPRLGWRLNAGDGTFDPFEVLVGEHVDRLIVTDFDLDGDNDLLVASRARREIAWYPSSGNLNFQPKQFLAPISVHLGRLDAADVDGDGDIDVLASSASGTWQLKWYENSQGEFLEHIVDGDWGFDFRLGDYDSDGDLDVSRFGRWMENDGSGNFINQHSISDDRTEHITGSDDLNGDGLVDILTNRGWYRSSGQKFEFVAIEYDDDSLFRSLQTISLDLDGDGDLDLLSELGESGGHNINVFVLHENVAGEFRLQQEFFPHNQTRYFISSIAAADLNGGGRDDPIIGFGSGESVWYDGMQEHRLSHPFHERVEGNELADLDNDGDLDVLLVTNSGGCLIVEFGCNRRTAWFENTDGLGTEWTEHSLPLSPLIAVGDIDGDGDGDILTSDYIVDIRWLENNDKTFRQRNNLRFDRRVFRYTGIALADVDGDFDLDAILHADETVWFENRDGGGDFGPAQSIGSDAGQMVVVDVDSDGDVDVVVGGRHGIVWYRNSNSGFHRLPIDGVNVNDLNATDTDGDGDQDLLAVIGDSLYEYERLDDDTFSQSLLVVSDVLARPHAIDFDQDADVDLVYYSASERGYVWLENDGGAFDSPSVLARYSGLSNTFDGQFLGNIHFGDIDQDGDIDALTGKSWHAQRRIGDVNDDGQFDSSDLVIVFQSAEYDDLFPMNSAWNEGDWNRDGDFNSSDLVFAFQADTYSDGDRFVAAVINDFVHEESERDRKKRGDDKDRH